ncbi:MAG: RNA polymerase sigma factor [Gammaproteobacteria bacterium]
MAEIATGNRDDALELVQEAMLQLARRYSSRDREEWRPLFYRILENGIRDWYRRQRTRGRWLAWITPGSGEEEPLDPVAEAADTRHPDPLQQNEQQETMRQIEQALRTMPIRQQQAFLLRAWEGLSTAETAQAMGCSEGSVKTHYSRALKTLRLQLEEKQP